MGRLHHASADWMGLEGAIVRGVMLHGGIRTLRIAAFGALGALVLAIVALLGALAIEGRPSYIAVDAKGALVPMTPISTPNHRNAAVASWITSALIDIFDFHYGNMQRRLNESSSRWFTRQGAAEFLREMDRSGNFEEVVRSRAFVSVALEEVPIFANAGIPPGGKAYAWIFQVRGTVSIINAQRTVSSRMLFTVQVDRVATIQGRPLGLAISNLVMERAPR